MREDWSDRISIEKFLDTDTPEDRARKIRALEKFREARKKDLEWVQYDLFGDDGEEN